MASSSACSSSQPDISSRMGPGVRRRTARRATGLTMGAVEKTSRWTGWRGAEREMDGAGAGAELSRAWVRCGVRHCAEIKCRQ